MRERTLGGLSTSAIGTRRPDRLQEALDALDVELTEGAGSAPSPPVALGSPDRRCRRSRAGQPYGRRRNGARGAISFWA
jgi:hypothetical protein